MRYTAWIACTALLIFGIVDLHCQNLFSGMPAHTGSTYVPTHTVSSCATLMHMLCVFLSAHINHLSRISLPYFSHTQQPFEVCCRFMCHSMLIGFTYIWFMDVGYVHTWFLVFRGCVNGFFAGRVYAMGFYAYTILCMYG